MTNFDEIINKTFDRFKKITPALVAIAITTGLILFLPDATLKELGLNNIPLNIRTFIGIVFILSFALICTIVLSELSKTIYKKIKFKTKTRTLYKNINQLSDEKKNILKLMLDSPEKNIKLDCTCGNTNYLIDNNFIYTPEQIIDYEDMCDNIRVYAPHPWLMECYEKNPTCLDVKTEVTHHDQL